MTSLLDELYSALEKKYSEDRGEHVHVSDISLCPREAVWRRLEPQKLDSTQLGFFTSGAAIGIAIQALATSYPHYKAEHEVIFEGLQAHVDLYDSKNNIPIECKSFNGSDMAEPKPHYVSQLKAYMAMLGAEKGIILVQLLQHFKSKNGGAGKPFKTWEISMTKEQILEERVRLMKEVVGFKEALMRRDPSKARHVMNDKELYWKCGYCAFKKRCEEMIAGEGKSLPK